MVNQSVAKVLVVEFDGRPLPPAVANTLVEGYVDDSRTLPDLFVLRFRDPGRVLLEQTGVRIGTRVRLLAGAGGGPSPRPLFTGSVTALEVEIDDTGTFTVVRGLDDSHRLLRGRRVASYQNMTLADICVRVARRAGLQPGTVEVAGPVLEHVAQPNVSDWEFLRSMAEEAGAQIHVADGRLHVVRPTGASAAPDTSARADRDPLVLEMGDNLLRCRAGVSAAEQVSAVEVRGWDVRAKQPLVGRADAGGTATLELGVTAAEVARPFGEADFVVSDVPYENQARVDQAAKALAARIAGSFAELEAVIRGNPEVRAGGAVALAGVGAPFEGRYTVTSSRHVFDPVRGYETWVTVSGQQERSLFGLTGGGPGGGAGGGSRCSGLANGTVTDTKDPEGLGRVKVRFPWLSDEYASDWARTAQSGGTGGGEAFIPEVGDEVLVGFEQGRLDRPYVLAALYNGQDRPGQAQGGQPQAGGQGGQGGQGDGQEAEAVDPTSGAVNKRAFGSRGGNKLELLDAANGPQGVRLVTGDGKLRINLDRRGTTIVVHSDGTVEIEAREQVSIKAGSGVALDAGNGTLELSGDSVKLTARTGVQVDGGTGEVRLSTGGAVEVRGGQVSVNGSSRTELRGGNTLTVNAPMVRIN
ncbi:type IV secretion protein Rhs [Streptomyces olivaceoviridis]|uniref:VgrG-related protein n=1 Tax=Streptomyces olivaceoviridis TaxID=1921 RepID=UPI001679C072|nr:VgrG-related protein [Streptomyces olivaceoviridis]GGZ28512.1 type IV secretion protein Rhs [Streptomyces olivaceoviridis]